MRSKLSKFQISSSLTGFIEIYTNCTVDSSWREPENTQASETCCEVSFENCSVRDAGLKVFETFVTGSDSIQLDIPFIENDSLAIMFSSTDRSDATISGLLTWTEEW